MKKYVKPELFYERFELSQHIADCAWELEFLKDACVAKPDTSKFPSDYGTLFTTVLNCHNTTDDGVYSDYCYHGGGSHANVFRS